MTLKDRNLTLISHDACLDEFVGVYAYHLDSERRNESDIGAVPVSPTNAVQAELDRISPGQPPCWRIELQGEFKFLDLGWSHARIDSRQVLGLEDAGSILYDRIC